MVLRARRVLEMARVRSSARMEFVPVEIRKSGAFGRGQLNLGDGGSAQSHLILVPGSRMARLYCHYFPVAYQPHLLSASPANDYMLHERGVRNIFLSRA